ncbi:MAG: hypothetical protein PQ964_06205 [Methanobacteriaceae archaeon]|jgi:hypothetical protein
MNVEEMAKKVKLKDLKEIANMILNLEDVQQNLISLKRYQKMNLRL